MVSFSISTKGKPTINVDFPSKHPNNVTVKELKIAVQAKFPKVCPHTYRECRFKAHEVVQLVPNRQRLTLSIDGGNPAPLVDESRTLGSYGVTEGVNLRLKDLGQQVGYRVLYLWEYVS